MNSLSLCKILCAADIDICYYQTAATCVVAVCHLKFTLIGLKVYYVFSCMSITNEI